MILSIDFDGTICVDQYPGIGAPVPYAIVTIQQLHKDGHYIILNTSRGGDKLIEAINWLLQHNIPFHRVNDNHPDATAKFGSNSRKVFADQYIDDRNFGGFPGWLTIYEGIKELQQAKEQAEQIFKDVETAFKKRENAHTDKTKKDKVFHCQNT